MIENNKIFGVYDKTRGVGGFYDYFGYFKKYSDAKKELKTQYEYIKRKRPEDKIILNENKVTTTKGEKEEVLIIIHPILVR